ncbi:hypothetical protein Tco_1220766 [Tanacetum coccineum]
MLKKEDKKKKESEEEDENIDVKEKKKKYKEENKSLYLLILATPTQKIWHGFPKLPGVKLNFVKHKYFNGGINNFYPFASQFESRCSKLPGIMGMLYGGMKEAFVAVKWCEEQHGKITKRSKHWSDYRWRSLRQHYQQNNMQNAAMEGWTNLLNEKEYADKRAKALERRVDAIGRAGALRLGADALGQKG